MSEQSTVADKAIKSTKWVALTELVTKATAPFIAVVLARLLSPSDYGLMTIAAMTNAFALMFWDAGLSRALIQAKEATDEMINVAFWVNVTTACVLYVAVLICAGWIAGFLNAPAATPVVRVMGIGMLLAALSSVHSTLLTRDLNFRRLFWLRVAGALVPVFVTIPLAFVGCGVWALVGGSLGGQALNLALLWSYSRWRPRFCFHRTLARGMARTGVWYFGESLVAWFFGYGDAFVIATFLNPHDLGLYRVGRSLVELVYMTCLNPVLQVAYPAFSRLQQDRASLTAAFQKATRLVLAVVCPLAVCSVLLGPRLVETLYGGKWEGLGTVVGILGVWLGLGWLVGLNPEVYRALGRPDVITRLNLVVLTYCLPVFILAARHGVQTFALARLGLTLVTLPAHVYLAHRLIGLPLTYLWPQGKSSLLASLAMAAALVLFNWGGGRLLEGQRPWLSLVTQSLLALVAFAASLSVIDRSFVAHTVRLGKRALGKG